jgi:hypothetical protein
LQIIDAASGTPVANSGVVHIAYAALPADVRKKQW